MITVDPADVEAWLRVPVDDIGYVDSGKLAALSDVELRDLVCRVEINRYQGWRNHDGLWTGELLRMTKRWGHTAWSGEPLNLDMGQALVLDWGCGLGIEALQYARAGVRGVNLADISQANVELAARVLELHEGPDSVGGLWVIGRDDEQLLTEREQMYDVIHCAGVLHHIRDPRPTVELWRDLIAPGGEVRLMVYSDIGWQIATGTDVIESADPELRARFRLFMDEVGTYATWYDEAKLIDLTRDLFQVTKFRYITGDDRYAVAILEPR